MSIKSAVGRIFGARSNGRVVQTAMAAMAVAIASTASALAQTPPPVTLKYLTPTISTTYIPIFAGIERGFFAEEGIKIDLVQGGNVAAMQTAFATGDIDTTQQDIPFWASLNDQGVTSGMVGVYFYVDRILVLPASDTTTPRPGKNGATWKDTLNALRGKTVGTLPGSLRSHTVALFKLAGIDAEKDLSLINLGTLPAQVAAIDQGQVNAVITTISFAYSIVASTKSELALSIVTQGPPEAKAGVLTATGISKAILDKTPGLAERYARALAKSVDYVRDPAHLNDLLAIAAKYNIVNVGGQDILTNLVKIVQRDAHATIPIGDVDTAIKWAVQTGSAKQVVPASTLAYQGLTKD